MKKIIIQFNTAQEEIDSSLILLKQYQKVGDKKNIEICKRNIKYFKKIIYEKETKKQ